MNKKPPPNTVILPVFLQGRSTVRNGPYKECERARNIIKRTTSHHDAKPLKVHVMHTTVVAHQTFALKLLSWLTEVAAYTGAWALSLAGPRRATGLS